MRVFNILYMGGIAITMYHGEFLMTGLFGLFLVFNVLHRLYGAKHMTPEDIKRMQLRREHQLEQARQAYREHHAQVQSAWEKEATRLAKKYVEDNM